MADNPTELQDRIDLDSVLILAKLDLLARQVGDLTADVQHIKNFVAELEDEREQHRRRKEQKRLEIEKKKRDEHNRQYYSHLIWRLGHMPWRLSPAPTSPFSPKEQELVSLLEAGLTDNEICSKMRLRASSIVPRIWVMKERLSLNSRQELIEFYLKYKAECREHGSRRCLGILRWLLNPPPRSNDCQRQPAKWRPAVGRGSVFLMIGPRVPAKVFDELRPYELAALDLKLGGYDNAEIGRRLKIKPTTVETYLADIRGQVKRMTGVTIMSEEDLFQFYRKYLKNKQLILMKAKTEKR